MFNPLNSLVCIMPYSVLIRLALYFRKIDNFLVFCDYCNTVLLNYSDSDVMLSTIAYLVTYLLTCI